jgi:hypothetical protein
MHVRNALRFVALYCALNNGVHEFAAQQKFCDNNSGLC